MTSISLAEFRGAAGVSAKNQVLQSQADANSKAGRLLAQANNPVGEIRLSFRGNYLGAFDITGPGFYTWGVANNALKRQLSLNGIKLICRSVEHSIDVQAGTLLTSAVFEAEAFGADGIPGNYPTEYPAVSEPPAPTWAAPFSPGLPVEVALTTVGGISLCPLASNSAMAVYQDEDDSYRLKARVLTVTGGVLSAGPASTVISGLAGSFQVVRASDSTVLLVYEDVSDGSKCKARVLTVTGSPGYEVITPGTAAIVSTASCGSICVDRWGSTSSYIAVFKSGGSTGNGAVLAVSGTAVTAFTPGTWSPTPGGDTIFRGVVTHATNDAVCVYYSTSSYAMYSVVLSNAAGTITPGAENALGISNTASNDGPHNLAVISASVVVAGHYDGASFIRTLSISGDVVSANTAEDGGGFAVAAVSSSLVVAGYPSTNFVDAGYSRTFGISGTTVTASGTETQFDADDIDTVDVAYLTDGYGVVLWREDVTNYAYCRLIPVSA